MARVLVIDDQKIPRVTVGSALAGAGYEVRAAESGPEGLEAARSWCPDVIVLDLHMPGMDGFEVVERLKQDLVTEPIPVIFLTAEAPSDELVVRGLALGAYDFLGKGGSRSELLARVGVMARIKRSHDELSVLARVSEVVVETPEPNELAERLVQQVAIAFRADAVVLVLPGDEAAPEVRAGIGIVPEEPRFYEVVDELVELVPGVGDAAMAADAARLAARAGLPYRSFAAVRVQRAGTHPMLLAIFAAAEAVFTEAGAGRLLEILGRQTALALDNAILHAQTRQQARTLREQAAELERAMTERSRFFASMSHELRTPINAVLGYSQLLGEGVYGPLTESQGGVLTRVMGSANHLLELVNDVLDISKIEAGKMVMYPEPIDMAILLREVMTSVELQARDKGLDLTVEGPRRFPMVTDAGRVRQVVLNLLSNAVKFTDAGGVTVRLEVVGEWVDLSVSDTGAGIAADDLERVFREFEQADSAAGKGGTGLGLAISRRLAELLGGTLRAESTLGQGSVFTLRLPITESDGQAAA
ncbi:MAG TPA: hybrid sensor histidine kinase/response regulator [Longimicrobium sp.]|nr:hybrid sensor histidine kinase/response regulator [Longimicrobium sp.]